MNRLLILSVSAGAGHVRAAQALSEAARVRWPAAEILSADVLRFTEPFYRKVYAKGYLETVQHAPELWGQLYRTSNRERPRALTGKLVRLFDRLEFARFRRFVRDFSPDVILATHFLPCQVLAPYRRRGQDRYPLGLVLTDFDAHAFWAQPTADRFFVATGELAAILAERGIPQERISVTGIPLRAGFSKRYRRSTLRRRLGLAGPAPVVLVMSGGAGIGSFADIVRRVLGSGRVQVLAVAGKNEKLRKSLQKLRAQPDSRLRVFGFVEDIAPLMAAADLFVGKSGGLTTAECLAMGLPMIVSDPIPGQEERNCDFLLEAGAGVKAHGPASLSYKAEALLADPERLKRMRRAALRVARPRAAQEILRLIELPTREVPRRRAPRNRK